MFTRRGMLRGQVGFFLINPKSKVSRGLPVGKCEGGDDMVCLWRGNESVWSRGVSNGVSRYLDSKISLQDSESWCVRLFERTFPESYEKFARM